ncbi:MAG: VWA domain-containing protein [Gammaproteobacteria bacterium]|nr:VWA domain-containing protein [Gammaproteobacteria bacterium]
MLIDFFLTLRKHQVKTSLKELLDLLQALKEHVVFGDVEEFYLLSRLCLIKDESEYDKFDVAFAEYFKGVNDINLESLFETQIPEEWVRKLAEKYLTDEEKAQIQSSGGFEELMKKLMERLAEQKERHQGGGKWIGTAGTSPFGAYGYNPEGIRIGQHESRHRRAAKVWDKREFRNLDGNVELGTRNIKVALKRLRKFARQGAADQLDLDDTIRSTAHKGMLDIKLVPERHNAVKVLLFLDIGGSMDDHIQICEELFSAARTEFKHLEYFYFHNCVYEGVWRDNNRRYSERLSTMDVIHTYGADYKLVFVGDASMSPYEIAAPGGSVEHWNEEAGAVWVNRLLSHFKKSIWLNPMSEEYWSYTQSIAMMRQLVNQRMFPLTLSGLDAGMRELL